MSRGRFPEGRPPEAGHGQAAQSAALAVLLTAVLLAGCVGPAMPNGTAAMPTGAPPDPWRVLPTEVSRAAFGGLSGFLSGGEAARVAPPSDLAGLLGRIPGVLQNQSRMALPVAAAEEPLLHALQDYAQMRQVGLPPLASLRAQVASLGLDQAGEKALAVLVLAYVQASELESKAESGLTPAEWHLLHADPNAVSFWFKEAPERGPGELLQRQGELGARVDLAQLAQGADLLARAAEAAKRTLAPHTAQMATPATGIEPSGAAIGPPLPPDAWREASMLGDALAARAGTPLGVRLPEVRQVSLPQALEDLRVAAGWPAQPASEPPLLPEGLADALAYVVEAKAVSLGLADLGLQARVMLAATQSQLPILREAGLASSVAGGPGSLPTSPQDANSTLGSLPQGHTIVNTLNRNLDVFSTPACPDGQSDCPALFQLGGIADNTFVRPAVVQIDLGGADLYSGVVAGDMTEPQSNAHVGGFSLDVGGNDKYAATGSAGTQGYAAAQEMSLLVDTDGNDRYEASGRGQGASQLGLGLLVDTTGDDTYIGGPGTQGFAQGSTPPPQPPANSVAPGQPGLAGLLDLQGNDHYTYDTQGRTAGNGAALFFDGGGTDAYQGMSQLADYAVGPTPTVADPQNAFAAQGRAEPATGNYVSYPMGAFMDLGPEHDAYEALATDGSNVDVAGVKDDVGMREQKVPEGRGAGFFSEDAAALAQDVDGDGWPGAAELVAGSDPSDPASNPGTLPTDLQRAPDPQQAPDPQHLFPGGGDPLLNASAPGSLATDAVPDPALVQPTVPLLPYGPGSVALPGLLIGGPGDSTYRARIPFLVDLGGNDTYLAPRFGGSLGWTDLDTIAYQSATAAGGSRPGSGAWVPNMGSVAFSLDLAGDDLYLPDPSGCSRTETIAAPGTQETRTATCASLGGALTGIAMLADAGGRNRFNVSLSQDITDTKPNAASALAAGSFGVTQGAAFPGAVGILVTWNASNSFQASVSTRSQLNAVSALQMPVTASSYGLAQGAALGGLGILAGFGDGNDTYAVDTQGQARVGNQAPCAPCTFLHDMAQGYAQDGIGVLYDGGGRNIFQAPHGLAQGSTSPVMEVPSPLNSGFTGFGILKSLLPGGLGALWVGSGDDRYLGGALSQGASGGTVVNFNKQNVQDALPEGQPTGFLLDMGGDDDYVLAAVTDSSALRGVVQLPISPDIAPSPQTFPCAAGASLALACSFSQGVGGNLDAHGAVASRGRGILLDLAGDDSYAAAGSSFVQGGSYFGGAGLLLDLGGHDRYVAFDRAQGYTQQKSANLQGEQASNEETSLSALVDAQGQDSYALLAPATANGGAGAKGQGFGPTALFADLQGNDRYQDSNRASGSASTLNRHQDGATWSAQNSTALDGNGLDAVPAGTVGSVGLQVKNAAGDEVANDATVAGTLTLVATPVLPPGMAVGRMDFLLNGLVFARGERQTDGTYTHVWRTRTAADRPDANAFPDGDYSLQASAFLVPSSPAAGSATGPDLQSLQSTSKDLIVDNAPLLVVRLPQDRLSPQVDPTPEMQVDTSAGAQPAEPVALRVVAQHGSDDPVTLFADSIPTGHQSIGLDLRACGGPCLDGLYRLHVTATDARQQPTSDDSLSMLLDGTPPTTSLVGYEGGAAGILAGNPGHIQPFLQASDVPAGGNEADSTGVAQVTLLSIDSQGAATVLASQAKPGPVNITATDGQTLRLLAVSQDELGNHDPACLVGEDPTIPGLALAGQAPLPDLCYRGKLAQARDVLVDFALPAFGDAGATPPVLRPGAPFQVHAAITAGHPGTPAGPLTAFYLVNGSTPPLPMVESAGTFTLQDDGSRFAGGPAREVQVLGTVQATDGAGNQASLVVPLFLDSRAPRVQVVDLGYQDGLGLPHLLGGSGPGDIALLRLRVVDIPRSQLPQNLLGVKAVVAGPAGGPALASVDCVVDLADEQLWSCPIPLQGMADGTHAFSVHASDLAGNVNDATTGLLEVSAHPLPIQDVQVTQVRSDGFTVQWQTPKPGTSQVKYGRLTPSHATPESDAEAAVTLHAVDVDGLLPGTSYVFKVSTRSQAGILNESALQTVRTLNAYSVDVPPVAADGAATWRGIQQVHVGVQLQAGVTGVHLVLRLLPTQGGSSPFTIADVAQVGNGGVTIAADTTQLPDGTYRLLVDTDRSQQDTFSWTSAPLTVDNHAPVVTPVAPAPGSRIDQRRPDLLLRVFDGAVLPPADQVRLTVNDAPMQPALSSYEASAGQQVLRLRLPDGTMLADGTNTVEVASQDLAGNVGSARWTFRVDTSAPGLDGQVGLTFRPGPSAATRGGFVHLFANLTDVGAVASAAVDLSPLGGASTPLLHRDGQLWDVEFKVPAAAPSGTTNLPLVARDDHGHDGTVALVALTVDTESPTFASAGARPNSFTTAHVWANTTKPTRLWATAPGGVPATDGVFTSSHELVVGGLRPNGTASIALRAVDEGGLEGTSTVTASAVPDLQPPSEPSRLTAETPGEGVVLLRWDAASDDAGIDHYEVRRIGLASSSVVGTAPGNQTTFRDGEALAGRNATYAVRAVDLGGNPGPAAAVAVRALAMPHLTNATVTPLKGSADEPFTFSVEYHHAAGLLPERIELTTQGQTFPLATTQPDRCAVTCIFKVAVRLTATKLATSAAAPPFSIHVVTAGQTADLALGAPPRVLAASDSGAHELTGKASPAASLLVIVGVLAAAALARRRPSP